MIRTLLILAAISTAPQDKAPSPWGQWKVGTTIKFSMTLESGGEKQEGTFSWTLAESSEKGLKVKQAIDIGGNTQEMTEEWGAPTKDGEETIKVEGKDYKCVIWKMTGTGDGKTLEVRYSVAEGKATPLRWKRSSEGRDEVNLAASALADSVTAGGKKYECVKVEGNVDFGGGGIKSAAWLSADVPGGLVKVQIGTDGDPFKASFAISEIDAKK